MRRHRVMSLISGMWGLGNIVGPATGGLLAELDPWPGGGSVFTKCSPFHH